MPKFRPGESGNPSGRPKSAIGIKAEIERRWGGNGAKLVAELSELAKDSNSRVRLQALELLLAYWAGKPTQSSTIDLFGSTLLIKHELGIPERAVADLPCNQTDIPRLPGGGKIDPDA